MVTIAAQRAGGAARALTQHAEAVARYYAERRRCAHCGELIPLPANEDVQAARRKKYCDLKCAAAANPFLARKGTSTLHLCGCGKALKRTAAACRLCLKKRRAVVTLSQTKGELFARRSNWQSARTAIQRLARAAYIASGLAMKCAVCGYSRHVEIAHRRAVCDFPESATLGEINAIENLQALCPNHHWEQEHTVVAGPGVAPG